MHNSRGLVFLLIIVFLIGIFLVLPPLNNKLAVDWIAEGEWIVFYCGLFTNSYETSHSSLYIMRPDGSELQRITGDEFLPSAPRWSPDGEWIAFINRHHEIIVIKPDGSDVETVAQVRHIETTYDIDWSATENTLVYNVIGLKGSSIRLVSVDDRSQTLVTTSDLSPARLKWSPDGKLIVFASLASSSISGIFTIPKEGGKPTMILEYLGIKGDIDWSNDGKQLLLDFNTEQKPHLYNYNVESRQLVPINVTNFWGSASFSPDEEWIIFSGYSPTSTDAGKGLQIYKTRLDDTENQRLTNLTDCNAASPQWIDFDAIGSNEEVQ